MKPSELITHYRARLNKEPHLLLPGFAAWSRGWWYKIKFRLQLKRFSAGRFFRVYGPLYVSGPGWVEFGDDCLVISNAIKPVCVRTLSRDAYIRLGDRVGLNGTSIQCVQEVLIGENSNIADAYITDTAAHNLGHTRRNKSIHEAKAEPVIIGQNVWISVQVVILHGVKVGNNTVIGACSLLRKDIPSDVFVAGNPPKILKNLDE